MMKITTVDNLYKVCLKFPVGFTRTVGTNGHNDENGSSLMRNPLHWNRSPFLCRAFSFLIILLLFTSCSRRSTIVHQDPDFYIYVLMGQSNMAGRGEVSSEFKNLGHERVVSLNQELEWVVARHPLHFDKPHVAGVGPGLSFGLEMAKFFPDKKIGLIPCAVGGTRIDDWLPGIYDEDTDTYPWNDAVIRIMEAMKYGQIKGIVWQQGESDSSPERSTVYLVKLERLIKRVRILIGNQELPFVVGELPYYRDRYLNLNSELQKLPDMVAHTRVASAKDLSHNGDGTHLSSESSHEFGVRMAMEMKKMYQILNK